MLEPDAPDTATWDGHADRIPAHPTILSTSSPNHSLEQSTLGERHGYYTHRHAQLVDLCQGDKHVHEAVQPTPSITPDLNPNTSSTTPSISVHRSLAQPALPQQRETVIMQEIPSYNHSKSSSENVNAHASKPENHRRNMIEPSKHHSAINKEPEVIDLTLSDEDHDKQIIQTTTATSRSSINGVESLFTPPPHKRRRRTLMDYVAVPPFQKGLTKANYSPMSPSLPVPIATGGVQYSSVCDALGAAFNQNTIQTPLPGKGKEKEREHIPAPSSSAKLVSREKSKNVLPSFGVDVDTTGNTLIDALYTQIAMPLKDPDVLPPIFRRTVVTNTRFAFAWRWGKLRKVLKPDEVERVMKYHLCPEDGNCASLQDGVSTGFTPMDTGRVLQQECPLWDPVPPSDPPKKADGSHQRTENVPDPTWHGTSALNSYSSSPTLGASGRPDIPLPPEAFRMDADAPMDQYLNCFGDSPSKQLSPSREGQTFVSTFRLQTPLQTPQLAGPSRLDNHAGDPFIDPALVVQSVERDGFLGVPPSPDVGETDHRPDSAPISPFLMDGRNEDGDALSGLYDDKPPSPWAEVGVEQATTSSGTSCPGDNAPSFESGTIDPSLLGGEQAIQAKPTGRKRKPRHSLPEPIIYVRRPQDALSLPWMRGNRSVQIKFRQQECPAVSDGQDEESAVVPPSPAQNNKALDDPDWVPDHAGTSEHRPTSKIKLRVSRTSITRVESDTDSSFVPTVAGPSTTVRSKEKPPRESTKGATGKVNDVPDKTQKTFCHHCRNTTNRLKMQCSNDIGDGRTCGKRFCQRCIQRRYPDITFDQFSHSFLCPYCTNTCNCSQCARKRGEEFISMRTGAFVGPRVQSKLTFMRDSVPAPPIDSTETAASTSETPNFWAHVYGLEGEHLGGAYWNQAASRPSGMANGRGTHKPPRVFIGHPQEYWKVRSARYLEPMSDSVSAFVDSLGNQGKGKGKAIDRPLRLFVGNPAALHEPFERMPRTPSPASSRSSSPGIDGLTPLSQLKSYWPQPDVGEWCSWEPPPPLGAEFGVPEDERGVSLALSDEQVARAIHVALAALS